ncbi:MBG domain-containing protein, partial [Flavobacterium orientale]|uniref:MBG domain-containing protein n=1 Tax=Flavobacterium orientale TaxID=1756020 RepID=UPI001668D026
MENKILFRMQNFKKIFRLLPIFLLIPIASNAQIFESFETGLPTSYNSVLTSYTLVSGSWQIKDVISGTTGVQSGTRSAQLRSATASQIITPTLTGGVGTISFYVTSSTISGAYQVNISTDNGLSWSPAPGSPFTISTTKTLRTILVNNPLVNKIQIYRTAATIYIDDFNATISAPQSTINGGVTSSEEFATIYGTASNSQSFVVSGSNLTNSLVATAPSGFEVSRNDVVSYGTTASYTASEANAGGISFLVRLSAIASAGTYNTQSVILSSTGATSVNITTSASGNEVSKAPLNITAGNQSVSYGTSAVTVLAEGNFSPTGFVNGDTAAVLGGSVSYTTTYVATSGAGTAGLTITPVTSSLTAANYSFTPVAGSVTVTPALLTVTADDKTTVEDTTLPPYTVSYTGFVNEEDENDLTVVPTADSPTADIATAGSYPIVASGGEATNYTFDYVNGTLTITSASAPLCPLSTGISPTEPQAYCQGAPSSVITASILDAGAQGTPSYQYQWYYNTTDSNTVAGATLVAGATSSTYAPATDATAVGTRYYFVVGYAADNGCGQTNTTQSLASTTVAITIFTTPTATITPAGPTTFCAGGSVLLQASPAQTYNWSNGATTASIIVTTPGDYSVVTTIEGCDSAVSAPVTVVVNPTPSTPTITPSGSTDLCFGEMVTLTASAGSTYLWSTGATTQSIDVNSTSAYTVVVTDANGCTSPSSDPTNVMVASALVPGSVAGIVTPLPDAQVVISQVYGGGGNSGAPFNRDFIELFNQSTTAISLDGWSVQHTSASGTAWNVTNLTGLIPAGGYYLVYQAGGSNGSPLPSSDAVGTIPMGAASGKVALVNNTTPLSGSISSGNGNGIIDFVGYGAANGYEGAGPTSAPSNTTAVIRLNAGCTDTNSNSVDFVTGTPTPRNSATPANSCGITAATETICSGTTPSALQVTAATGSTGSYAYSWYQFDGTTTAPTGSTIPAEWTLVGTGTNFTPEALTASATFASYVTPNGCAGAWASGQRQVFVNDLPTAIIEPTGTIVLPAGTPQELTATGGTDFVWSTTATTATITATTSGSYTVITTDANGCESPASEPTVIAYAPAVISDAMATDITLTSATLSGTVTASGDTAVSQRGIVYAETGVQPTPVLGADFVTTLVAPTAEVGPFSLATATDLTINTTYSYRAFATNEQGTTYGEVVTFTTLSNLPNATLVGDAPSFEEVCTTGSSNSAITSFVFDGNYLESSNLNVASAAAELTFSLSSDGVYSNPLVVPNAGATLTNQEVWVRFTPTQTGAFSATVAISGAGITPEYEFEITGFGVNTPVLVTTTEATAITSDGATLSGSTTAGCSAVITSGVSYSLSSDMTNSTEVPFGTAVTGLTANTLYYYQAFAQDATGLVYGAQLSFTTNNLAAPNALPASGETVSSFVANWEPVVGATSYRLDVSTNENFAMSVPGSTTTETFDNVGGGTASTYTTRSWTGVGEITWTAYKSRTDEVVFSGNPAITLRNEADAYLISNPISGGLNAISFDVKQAFTGSGGELSVTVLHGPGFVNSTPVGTQPYNTNVSTFSAGNLNISGDYIIRIDNNASARPAIDNLSFTSSSILTPSLLVDYNDLNVDDVTTYPVTGLLEATTYYYRVRAVAPTSVSVNSNPITVITLSAPATFGSIAQAASVCDGQTATFNVTGLLAQETTALTYQLNGGEATTIALSASPGGTASFALPLAFSLNGTSITVLSVARMDDDFTIIAGTTVNLTENNTATLMVTAQSTWYVDVDNDNYYTGEAVVSCDSPGATYKKAEDLLGGGDCNDNDASIYPGAPVICYDNISQDCNTDIYDGCAIVLSRLRNDNCGATLTSINQTLRGDFRLSPLPAGTNITGYTFFVKNLSTGAEREV